MGTQHNSHEVSLAGWRFMTWDKLKCTLLNTHMHVYICQFALIDM